MEKNKKENIKRILQSKASNKNRKQCKINRAL